MRHRPGGARVLTHRGGRSVAHEPGDTIRTASARPLVGYSASVPWHRAEANISVVNSWTKTLGNHTIKWGVDYRRLRDDLLQTQTINPRGLFNFDTAQTSLNPGAGRRAAEDRTGRTTWRASCWISRRTAGATSRPTSRLCAATSSSRSCRTSGRYRSKLTLDFGLRWEFYPPPTPRHSRAASPTTTR